MSGAKLTPWFPGHVKPARVGVYMQISGSGSAVGYQKWDGKRWFGWCGTPEQADRELLPVAQRHQNDQWRGLASDPGVKS